LTEAQLLALRFASDSELPALLEEVLAAKMPGAGNQKEHRGMACRYISRVKRPHSFKVFHHDASRSV
jgi:hypothetical protein